MQRTTGRFVSRYVVILACFTFFITHPFAEDRKYPKSWDDGGYWQQKRDSGNFPSKREMLYEWDATEVHDYLEIQAFYACFKDPEAQRIFGFTRAEIISDLGSNEEYFWDHFRQGIANLGVGGLYRQVRSMSGNNFNRCLRTHTLILCPTYYGNYLGLEEGRVKTFCE
ncbi:MAG: hypothetical protein OXC95_02155 [Dehalococcoidia bacterium]|nr:hypothetical protein [Dehalococcoidia bacterium]